MPIYEYECHNCGHTLDALEKVADKPQRKCPECGRLKLKRLVSAPKFRLKGSGWYETDFKKDNQRNLAGDQPKPDKKDNKADKNSADTKKPADKSKSKSSSAAAD